LQGVWDNFGRVMAEYAFLDQLYDYDPLKPHKWIVIDPADIARCHDVRTKAEPVVSALTWQIGSCPRSHRSPTASTLPESTVRTIPQLSKI
jgi:hypothetical protein